MQGTDKTADLYRAVLDEAVKRGSLYSGTAVDKRDLIVFLQMNDWFGIKGSSYAKSGGADRDDVLPVDGIVVTEVLKHLALWIDAYGRKDPEKLDILAGHGKKILPITTAGYSRYIKDSGLENDANSWKLLDFLLAMLPRELDSLREDEIRQLMDEMDQELPLVTARLFVCFYEDMQEKKDTNGWIYRFNARNQRRENEAYSIAEFSRMAYCIFNESHWEEYHLLEKACTSEGDANLWIFLAMHFVCGMRATDIERIPKPELPYEGGMFRRKLLDNQIRDSSVFSQDVQMRIKYKPYHPNKTLSYSNIPEIKLFIPVSLEKPLGAILAIAASFHDDKKVGTPFIKVSRKGSAIKKFFGDPFADILRGKSFSSRRANKAYLQGIEAVAGMDGADAPKGYMLAALARSHKGGIGNLPGITEIYLKDAGFSGYTPEFIAKEMFERGVFGFIPHLLLESYAGDTYQKLPVARQTSLIQGIGIEATKIERLISLSEKSFLMAKETVNSMVIDKGEILNALQRVAAGTAPGKDTGSLCMMAACGYSCKRPESRGCIGCRYEIYTKSVMHQMIKEYARMKALCGGEDEWRYREMIRQTILPMVGELLKTMKSMFPDSDMGLLTEIMEGGMGGYDCFNEPDCSGRLQQISSNQKH